MSTTWDLPLDGLDIDEVGKDFEAIKVGKYHVQILDLRFEEQKKKKDESDKDAVAGTVMVVKLEILNGTVQTEIGKSVNEYFYTSAGSRKRALKFALACGITTEDELRRLQQARMGFSAWASAIGKQICVGFHEEEYEKKIRTKIGFDMWAVDSDAAKDVPKNQAYLTGQGRPSVPDPFAPQQQAAPRQQQLPTQQVQQTAAVDPLEGMGF